MISQADVIAAFATPVVELKLKEQLPHPCQLFCYKLASSRLHLSNGSLSGILRLHWQSCLGARGPELSVFAPPPGWGGGGGGGGVPVEEIRSSLAPARNKLDRDSAK